MEALLAKPAAENPPDQVLNPHIKLDNFFSIPYFAKIKFEAR